MPGEMRAHLPPSDVVRAAPGVSSGLGAQGLDQRGWVSCLPQSCWSFLLPPLQNSFPCRSPAKSSHLHPGLIIGLESGGLLALEGPGPPLAYLSCGSLFSATPPGVGNKWGRGESIDTASWRHQPRPPHPACPCRKNTGASGGIQTGVTQLLGPVQLPLVEQRGTWAHARHPPKAPCSSQHWIIPDQ